MSPYSGRPNLGLASAPGFCTGVNRGVGEPAAGSGEAGGRWRGEAPAPPLRPRHRQTSRTASPPARPAPARPPPSLPETRSSSAGAGPARSSRPGPSAWSPPVPRTAQSPAPPLAAHGPRSLLGPAPGRPRPAQPPPAQRRRALGPVPGRSQPRAWTPPARAWRPGPAPCRGLDAGRGAPGAPGGPSRSPAGNG